MTAPAIALPEERVNGQTLLLSLTVSDPAVISYLARFDGIETVQEKAIEALRIGVTAIQSASPTLDTQVVQAKFAEVEGRLREQMGDFQQDLKQSLVRYFEEQDGVVPRSIDGVFGDDGSFGKTLDRFFHPNEGRLCKLMQSQIGPGSSFAKVLDPENKSGVVSLIEARVREIVEAKLAEVLQQFSLDEDGSAMWRLQTLMTESFHKLNTSLGIKSETAKEAERGHVKGIEFEKDLYEAFAKLAVAIGDETELVRGIGGVDGRCKTGDFVAVFGDTCGAPGTRLVVEVKQQPIRFKAAIDELKSAKQNRQAEIGIFVFARGCEPPEVGDFRRVGEDFYVTVDKADLETGRRLLFLESAYKISRALAVAAARQNAAGELDLQRIRDQVDGLSSWSDRIADMVTKSRTIQNSGKAIESASTQLKQDLGERVMEILKVLQRSESVSSN